MKMTLVMAIVPIMGVLHMSILVRPLRQVSESFLLIQIESFVELVVQQASFRKVSNHQALQMIKFNLNECLSLYEPDLFDYSEHINAFWYGCTQLGLFDGCYHNGLLLGDAQIQYLMDEIWAYTQQKDFKRKVSDRRDQTRSNWDSLESYILKVQQKYARLLVIRVDFGYAKEHQDFVKITDVYHHLDIMNQQRHTHPLFEHLVSSGWRIEQGKDKGYHIHAFYFFKGSEHQHDGYLAQEIGHLWKDITHDFGGGYHSCNTKESKEVYKRAGCLGVGMIRRDDKVACENVIAALRYLVKLEKEDQYLRMRPKRRRTFGRGLF